MPKPAALMQPETATRRYRRLLPAQEAELRALWESGTATADDLAARLGMSRRGVQAALKRLGAKKGAASSAITKAVSARILAETVPAHPDLAVRTREAKEAVYRHAVEIEAMAMAAAREAAAGELGAASALLRVLDLTSSVLARTRTLRWAATGLDGRSAPDGDPPVLLVQEMTEAEVAQMRQQQEEEDAITRKGMRDHRTEETADPDADDVVIEGDEAAAIGAPP